MEALQRRLAVARGDEPADLVVLVPDLEWPSLGDNVTMPTFLVDGFVAGLWKPQGKGAKAAIELRALAPITAADRRALEHDASSLLRFLEPRADPGAVRWWSAG